jgi:hypothetical protein
MFASPRRRPSVPAQASVHGAPRPGTWCRGTSRRGRGSPGVEAREGVAPPAPARLRRRRDRHGEQRRGVEDGTLAVAVRRRGRIGARVVGRPWMVVSVIMGRVSERRPPPSSSARPLAILLRSDVGRRVLGREDRGAALIRRPRAFPDVWRRTCRRAAPASRRQWRSAELDDDELVAVRVAEGEHRRDVLAHPADLRVGVDAAVAQVRVEGVGVRGREADPGVSARGGALVARGRGRSRPCRPAGPR